MLSPNGRILQLDSSDGTAVGAQRTDANGKPVRSYVKSIMRAGAIVKNVAGQAVTISSDFLDSIAASFSKMKAAGIKVPIQLGHNESSDNTRGYVTEVWREGDELKAQTEMIGEDGIALASRSEVSVYVEPSHEVGGVKYIDALLHLACVPNPQITNLGGFTPMPIAASLSGQVFRLSNQGTSPMWKPIALALSLDVSKLDDTTGPAACETAAKATVAERNAAATALNEANTRNAALSLSVSKGAPQIGEDLLDEHADIVGAKLDGLVTSGIVTPDQKTKLSALFTGEKGKRPALCLSRAAATHAGLSAPLALSVIDILATGKGKSFGAKTGDQGRGSTNDDAPEAPGADFHSRVDSYLPGAAKK